MKKNKKKNIQKETYTVKDNIYIYILLTHVFLVQCSLTSNATLLEHSCVFCLATLKPTGFLISPALVLEEAEEPVNRPPVMPIAQSSPLTLSPALRVETCIKLCKCESFVVMPFPALVPSHWTDVRLKSQPIRHLLIFISLFNLWFSSCWGWWVSVSLSGVCMSMTSPCRQTCTPRSTRSGSISGSGTWRLACLTASLSPTWWREAACILRGWDPFSIQRGLHRRRALDGNTVDPTSDTIDTRIG